VHEGNTGHSGAPSPEDKPEGSGDDLGEHFGKLVEKATDKVISTSWLGQVMMKVRDQN